MQNIRLRFAPSPTGALHIGGIRTALYNELFARRHGGVLVLRIEDTDQSRYLPGAEAYIIEALQWCGIHPDEGPGIGGAYGPYRQSERSELYQRYARQLVASGNAYYAFDTPEELDAKRQAEQEAGNPGWKYDAASRLSMRNSLSLPAETVQQLLEDGTPYTVRLLVPTDEEVVIQDRIRGEVVFQTNELDDKVMLKADGLPTYHLANIVDDHLMEISHVIRGEEWLSSTAHHVLLYRAFGWEDTMPEFAHLPLILKPAPESFITKNNMQALAERFAAELIDKQPEVPGLKQDSVRKAIEALFQDKNSLSQRLKIKDKDPADKQAVKGFLRDALYGKLSKRDGDRLGIPVFPLSWDATDGQSAFLGFREAGFLPPALINFLAFLGWNPGTEQEMFSREELIQAFSLDQIGRSGARFDYDKARWFNQQYLLQMDDEQLMKYVRPFITARGHHPEEVYLREFCSLLKERAVLLTDFWEKGYYFFEPVKEYDEEAIRKRYRTERRPQFEDLVRQLEELPTFDATAVKNTVEAFMAAHGWKYGDVLPVLRLGLAGTVQGPDVFRMMELLGRSKTADRMRQAFEVFEAVHATSS